MSDDTLRATTSYWRHVIVLNIEADSDNDRESHCC